MPLEKKIVAGGGMDMDTDERFVAKTDYRKAVNCRINASDEDSAGTVENIRSNKHIINPNFTSGTVIGSYEDLNANVVYYFVHGGITGTDSIFKYDPQNELIETVLQSNILNFGKHKLITGVNVLGDDQDKFPQGLLYWTDDKNPPRKINIDKALTGGYPVIDAQTLNAIKYPPSKHPECIGASSGYTIDTTFSSNQLKGKSYQFKYRWIYDDGEKSTWSPISPVYIDNTFSAFYNITGQTQNTNNVLPVKFNSGHHTVDRIQISSRNTNGLDDFILIADIKKSDVTEKVTLNSTATVSAVPTTFPGTLGDDLDCEFYFYNDGIYSTIDIIESNMLYSDIPHQSKAQEIVEGNRLVYGNVVTGQTGVDTKSITLSAGQDVGGSAIANTGTTTNIADVDVKAMWNAGGSVNTNSQGTKRQQRGVFYVRWLITPPATNCFNAYRLSVSDLVFSKTIEKDGSLFGTKDAHDGNLGVINMSYNSGAYGSSTSTWNIAGNISSQLANLPVLQTNITNGGQSQSTSSWNVRTIAADFIQGTSRLTQPHNVEGSLDVNVDTVTFYPSTDGSNTYVNMKVSMAYGPQFHLDQTALLFCEIESTPDNGDGTSIYSMSTNWHPHQSTSAHQVSGRANTHALCLAVNEVGFAVGIGYDMQNLKRGAGRFKTSNVDRFELEINDSTYATTGTCIVDISSGDAGFMTNLYNAYHTAPITYSNTSDILGNSQFASICPTGGQEPIVPSFKTGAKHRFGIVYYDEGNRSTSVQLASVSDVYVPKNSDLAAAPNPAGNFGEWHIDWEINHDAPSWATHYQWVYGGNTLTDDFIQFVTEGIYDGVHALKDDGSGMGVSNENYGDNILVDISNINQYAEANGGGVVSYDFQEGDMLRLVLDQNDNDPDATTTVNVASTGVATLVPSSLEFKIVGRVGQKDMADIIPQTTSTPIQTGNGVFGAPFTGVQDYIVLARESVLVNFLDSSALAKSQFTGWTCEIYSPKKKTDEDKILYHEFDEWGTVSGGLHTAVDDTTTNTWAQNQTSSLPAKGRFRRGDVYLRNRVTRSSKLITPIESFHYSDNFKSDYWGKGRPNAVLEDFKRTRKFATCLYSEPYIPNTNINGLNLIVPDVSFQEFERSYNSIQKLHSRDNNLIIFQEDKISKSLVNKNIIYNMDGSGNIGTSDSVLSISSPYLGNYGICKNPESFASHGLRIYFTDIKRGCVLRLSQDGLTEISMYKMKDYFSDLSVTILKEANFDRYKIKGTFDRKYGEYIVSYDKILGEQSDPYNPVIEQVILPASTLGFTEKTNRWNSFYTYYPEMMGSSGMGIITYIGGKLYHHDIGVDALQNKEYNKFYGNDVSSDLWLISNEIPSNNKVYKAVSTESDDVWSVSIENKHGQATNVLISDFDTRENIHYAQVLNDINSPGGIIEGDKIRSTSALIKLSNSSNLITRLFAVNVNIFSSERNNK
tara:strand:+ start:17340 stop:21689 length:4350 start_codon:yes stop_codon:yes gene_type:complete